MTRHPIARPLTVAEFALNTVVTALALYAIGAVMGVQWFG